VNVWTARAAEATQALVDTYWDRRRGLFRTFARPWHYWWQAHALDALVLAGDRERAAHLLHGVVRRNHGRITNEYNDDMAWMGLALHGLDPAHPFIGELIGTILRHTVDGIVEWRHGTRYLNVAANAPTAILLARIQETETAQRLTDWLYGHLVAADGTVFDGLHPGGPPDRTQWTYNVGTTVAADVVTGHFDRARRVAQAFARRFPGVLPAEGSGDRALFKGVFARHYATYAAVAGDSSLLVRNAEAAWVNRSSGGLFGPQWTTPPRGRAELSAHLSGVLLLHAAASLTRPRGDGFTVER
jgi:predicted alpha-1,6-mannanase (GH76 family)